MPQGCNHVASSPALAAAVEIDWERFLKKQVKDLMGGTGWTVLKGRNNTVYLQFRQPGRRGEKHPSTTVKLPYLWAEASFNDVLARCRVIQGLMTQEGIPLKQAALIANGASSRTVEDWSDAVDRFESFKRNHGKVVIGDRTWQEKYFPVLVTAVRLIKTGQAHNGTEVLEMVSQQWKPGTRAREIAVRSTSSFLGFCTDRLKFNKVWEPPKNTGDVTGTSRASSKRVGYPLTEEEICRLVAGMENPEHQLTIQTMALYGLRPEDCRYVKFRNGEPWSVYRKAAGGGVTKERKLFPLLVDGEDWDVPSRLAQSLPLRGLGKPGYAGANVGNLLRRNPVWNALRDEVKAKGHQLTAYSFRHGYVRRGQMRGIPPKLLADALGHSLQAHLNSYSAWGDSDAMSNFFD